MADTKLTALTETTSPATSDDVYVVTTPGGTPSSKRCTIANLKTAMGVPPTTTPYVTTAADAGLSAEVVIPGFAGSADIKGAAGGGTSHEFDSGETAPTWIADAPAVTDIGTTFKSHFYAKVTDGAVRFALWSWSPAGDFDARCCVDVELLTYTATPDMFIGLIIVNSDRSVQSILRLIIHTFGGWIKKVQAFTYASSTYTQRGTDWALIQPMVYLRMTRVSGTFTFYWSVNGLTWTPIASQALTITVSHIGFWFGGDATVTDGRAIADWLRTDV